MSYSLTATGLLITVLAFIFQQLKIDISGVEIEQVASIIAQLLGILIAWYGRIRKGDLSLLGFRKEVK